jgi:GTP-binding protein
VFQSPSFLLSVGEPDQLPPDQGAEVAFAGRSNAGKSSAINAICGRRKLAFVSRTPGRTQLINFFQLSEGRYLVDLPGYGYAKVPDAVQARWEALLETYLRKRRALNGLLLVMDARHPLTPLDRRMLDWFAVTLRPVHVLLTKADKLTRQAALRQLNETRAQLSLLYPSASAQLFSSASLLGVDEAREVLARLLDGH